MLVDGTPDVPCDESARADCPVPPKELRHIRTRLERMRNPILHLGEKRRKGTEVNVLSESEPTPQLVISTTDRVQDSIERAEIIELLDQLDPWLKRQFDRIVSG